MPKRVIYQVTRDSEGDIRFLINQYADWSPRSVRDVIRDIDSGEYEYVVPWPGEHGARVQVVNGPNGKYIRTTGDDTRSNNLDNLSSVLPEYLGNYPDEFSSDWTDDLQGVTHSADHWFFTRKKRLLKFRVSTDLESGSGAAVDSIAMPPELEGIGCNHFGDPEYVTVGGSGFVLIPVEGDEGDNCGDQPRLAVFRDSPLAYVGATSLTSQNVDGDSPRAGWCAVSPFDGRLYSSHNRVNFDFPIYRYDIDYDALLQDEIVLNEFDDLVLRDSDGSPISIPQYMQGGCFSPEGFLFLINGKRGSSRRDGGIRVFDRSGTLLYKSSTSTGVFRYEFDPGLPKDEEPEGICYWDLDALPAGTVHSRVMGQLHAILLDNDIGADDIYFKHYKVAE